MHRNNIAPTPPSTNGSFLRLFGPSGIGIPYPGIGPEWDGIGCGPGVCHIGGYWVSGCPGEVGGCCGDGGSHGSDEGEGGSQPCDSCGSGEGGYDIRVSLATSLASEIGDETRLVNSRPTMSVGRAAG